jgi:hypothetical protein
LGTEIVMRATLRGALRVMLLLTMLAGVGSTVGVAEAAAATRPLAASNTPPVPTSQIKSIGDHTATYCVSNYAPNSTVTVVNQHNSALGAIHTDGTGAGCTTIAIDRACATSTSQTIVASGLDATGKAATSQAIAAAPADPSLCSTSSPTPTPSPTDPCAGRGATVTVSVAGVVITLRGSACGFQPFEPVDAFAHSTPVYLGSTTAHADGTATVKFSVPVCLAAGNHTLELVGETSGNVASAPFSVSVAHACAAAAGGGGQGGATGATGAGGGQGGISASGGGTTGSNSGSLAFTGADILAMVLAALVLLVVGSIAVVAVRRRRTDGNASAA